MGVLHTLLGPVREEAYVSPPSISGLKSPGSLANTALLRFIDYLGTGAQTVSGIYFKRIISAPPRRCPSSTAPQARAGGLLLEFCLRE